MKIDPATLDEDVPYDGAQVVFCSRLSAAIDDHALAWVLLYPDGENFAVVSVARQQRSIADPGIADLLAVIEEAWRLAHPEDGGEGDVGRACKA